MILHNRHKNLDRLLEYYDNYGFNILIADSSVEKHHFKNKKPNWSYSYTPLLSFSQKLEVVLASVSTPYVVMCADDDFIIPESIIACASFLESNSDYAVAQGLCIRYERENISNGQVEYGAIYKNAKNIEQNDPLQRLHAMFEDYRSVLYAVFRTEVLQQAYSGAGNVVKNLYLNEYVTAFIPVLFGKSKELPILYQVREYALDSDDKTTTDIDRLVFEKQFEGELNNFKSFIAKKIVAIISISDLQANEIVNNIIHSFANTVRSIRSNVSPKKKIGKLINNIPIIGVWLIRRNRSLENKTRLKAYINMENYKKEIGIISRLLLKYNNESK